MRLRTVRHGDVSVVRVEAVKLTYPVLRSFYLELVGMVEGGAGQVVLDLQEVAYIDSPAIGCLMDVHRLLQGRRGALRLCGLQPRVETMLFMTGVHRIVEVHPHAAEAVEAVHPLPEACVRWALATGARLRSAA